MPAEQVAATDSTLLLGETATGKELIATTIHELSPRKDLRPTAHAARLGRQRDGLHLVVS